MKKDISTTEIANYLEKSASTISGWNTKFPKLLELCKLGFFCKKNDLDIEKIKRLVEIKEMFQKIQGKD